MAGLLEPVGSVAALPGRAEDVTAAAFACFRLTAEAVGGEAPVDLFFGSGEDTGTRAGGIRHGGSAAVLLPRPRRS